MPDICKIIGIDPGLRHTGWGVIAKEGAHIRHIAHGEISPSPDQPLALRLGDIADGVAEILAQYAPELAGIEETFVNANPRQALLLGQARGAAMVSLARGGLSVMEFSPRRVKQAIVGTGKADKTQIAFMIKRLLPKAKNLTADAADALAIAITAAHHSQIMPQKAAFA